MSLRLFWHCCRPGSATFPSEMYVLRRKTPMCATKCFEMYLGVKEKTLVCPKVYTFQGHLWLDCVLLCGWHIHFSAFCGVFSFGLGAGDTFQGKMWQSDGSCCVGTSVEWRAALKRGRGGAR